MSSRSLSSKKLLPGQPDAPAESNYPSIEWLLKPTRAREGLFEGEEDEEEIDEMIAGYRQSPLKEVDFFSKKRRKDIESIWQRWLKFAKRSKCDAEQVWIDICIGREADSKPHFQAFITKYIKDSKTQRPCLGPEEWQEVQTIEQASTAEDVWATLVKAADIKVMAEKRRCDPENPRWNLEYSSRKKSSRNATICQVGRWICMDATKLGLQLLQSFEKVEATTEDVLLLLHNLWHKAEDIPCSPQQRVAFHTAVILLGLGGWRPASVMQLKYRAVEIGRVRDPGNPRNAAIVATITIDHVKQKVQIRRDQRNRLKFSATFVPCNLLCLLSLLLCKAFADNAFAGGFRTLEELLPDDYQLSAEVDYVPLSWREDLLGEDEEKREKEKEIIPLTYREFIDLWNLCLFVIGMRVHFRAYSLRVGVAGKMDGQLSSALRNYILSHSSDVYENSYHPVHVRENLMSLAFGSLAGQKDELLSQMCRACLKRDPRAPIYISKEDFDRFECRRDLTMLRQRQKEVGSGSPEGRTITSRIQYIRNCLEALLIDQRRREYFQSVDTGRSVEHLVDPSATDPRYKVHKASSRAAKHLAHLFEDEANNMDLVREITLFIGGGSLTAVKPGDKTTVATTNPRCLLCQRRDFVNSQTLSRHVWKQHTFNHQFPCPECQRLGNGDVVVRVGREAWSSHVARHHQQSNVPNPVSARTAYCPFCSSYCTPRGFNRHLGKHRPDISGSFLCPECIRKGESRRITGEDAWISHVINDHGGDRHIRGAVIIDTQKEQGRNVQLLGKRRRAPQEEQPCKRLVSWSEFKPEREAERCDEHSNEEYWVTGRDEDY